jgi:hypothetical protein
VRPGSSGLGGRSRSSAPNFNPSIGGNVFQMQPEMSGAVGGFLGETRDFSNPNPIPFQHINPPPLQPADSHVETGSLPSAGIFPYPSGTTHGPAPAPAEDQSLGSLSYLNDYTLLGGVAGGEGADDQQALLEGLPGTLMDWKFVFLLRSTSFPSSTCSLLNFYFSFASFSSSSCPSAHGSVSPFSPALLS